MRIISKFQSTLKYFFLRLIEKTYDAKSSFIVIEWQVNIPLETVCTYSLSSSDKGYSEPSQTS